MKKTLTVSGLALLVALAYLLWWPVPIEPVAWQAPAFAGYTGPYARNDRLASARAIPVAPDVGPEHIAFGPDGRLYTGVLSGSVLRMNADGSGLETFVNTGGRPLGLDFTGSGSLVVADAVRGLLEVRPDRSVTVLADRLDGSPILYADAVAVAANGYVYLTDATGRFSPRQLGTFQAALFDVMEHSCTGRVLEYRPDDRRLRVVMTHLCFPNGVVLAGDQAHLFIAETGEYRIWKVDTDAQAVDARVAGGPAGDSAARVVLADLPGFPDNLTRDASGRLWTGLSKPRSEVMDRLSGWPRVRAMTLRLPQAWWPVPPAYGHVIAFTEDGRILADLQDPEGRIPETSGVTEHDGNLYVQSLHGEALGVLPDAAAGL
jgi:sugar lactone lactonase YvrE